MSADLKTTVRPRAMDTTAHHLPTGEVESRLGTSSRGLASEEVRARRARYGTNEIEEAPPTTAIVVLLRQFRSPLVYVLLLAVVVTLALAEYVDAGVIAAVLALNAIIGFTQERKAEASVRALSRLVTSKARVVRDGREEDIESAGLVPGDLVLLESGLRVPADLRLVTTTALRIDESLFTGESEPSSKLPDVLDENVPVADRANMAFTGTIVTTGRGRGYVVATGLDTELGAIADRLRERTVIETPLQERMKRFSQLIGIAVGAVSLVGFGVGVALGHSVSDMFMLAVALAVAAIPEGLPVVFTITLAVGVRRMAERHAIIRKLPAVETLGSTTVIGSDKTGTLTENRMTVEEIWAGGESVRLDAPRSDERENHALRMTVLTGVLANEADYQEVGERLESTGDPTEVALLVAGARQGVAHREARAAYESVAEIPFEPAHKYSASIRRRDGVHVVYVKGAPERILELSTRFASADGAVALDRDAVLAAAHAMAARGLRVLAMAYRELEHAPTSGGHVAVPDDLVFAGLVGMMDPPRAGVYEAIEGCRAAGMRVVMITGDHAATARAIGHLLGIGDHDAPVLTGSDLEELDDPALSERLSEVSIFARVAPEQKLRVVRLLRERGEVVAVTGDGVNDAPALRAADIGIAMGLEGTDVAREAADMVLADDNFVSIYHAVEQGRVTFDNLRKATFFLVSTGAGTVLTLIVAMILGWPLPFVPAQLLWLNLVTNGLQDVALAFEPGERGVLEQPPRPRGEGILSRLLWERTALSGIVTACGALYLFDHELTRSGSLSHAQTVALTTMVIFQVFQVGNSRSERLSVFAKSPFSNPFLFWATLAAVTVHLTALNFGPTQFILRVEPLLDVHTWTRIIIVTSSLLAAMELHKISRRGKRPLASVFRAGHPASVDSPSRDDLR
jgi:calcium-translocating P-type ATPase